LFLNAISLVNSFLEIVFNTFLGLTDLKFWFVIGDSKASLKFNEPSV
jgi:hypothetical protein